MFNYKLNIIIKINKKKKKIIKYIPFKFISQLF